MEYNLNRNILSILQSAIRKVTNYVEGDEPSAEVISDAFDAFVKLIKHLERNKGIRFFNKVWRQHIFEPSNQVYVTAGTNYRCTKSHDVPAISTWAVKTGYLEGDAVYPSTYSGYYFEASNTGYSGSSEPSFNHNQNMLTVDDSAHPVWVAGTSYTVGDVISPTTANSHFFRCLTSGTADSVEPDWLAGESTILDGTVEWERFEVIIWKCIPDTKPGVGKNYRTYWRQDDSLSDSDSTVWSVGTSYQSAADFILAPDELCITSANIMYQNSRLSNIAIIEYKDFIQDEGNNSNTGLPDALSVEVVDLYTRRARISSIPLQTGADGYVLHYETVLKTSSPDDQNANMEYLDGWFLYLEFQLAANLGPEYGLPIQEKIYLDKKAAQLYRECQSSDEPKVTKRKVSPCY